MNLIFLKLYYILQNELGESVGLYFTVKAAPACKKVYAAIGDCMLMISSK